MKRLLRFGGLSLVLAMAFAPSHVQAFNSATHIFIAERVFPFSFDKIDLYYGSIAPDLSMYIPDDPAWSLEQAFMDTHYYSLDLPYAWWKPTQKAFAKGWKTHNEIWGADFYAHGPEYHRTDGFYIVTGYNGYVVNRADELISWALPYGISLQPELAHFAVEVAIDLLLLENNDHYLGQKLLGAALLRSPEDLNLLGKAFPDHLQTLILGESTFRGLVIRYATALTLPKYLRMQALGQLGVEIAAAMGAEITSQNVQAILTAAIALCAPDYMDIITEAINAISNEIR
jgi:hypothetical protein